MIIAVIKAVNCIQSRCETKHGIIWHYS